MGDTDNTRSREKGVSYFPLKARNSFVSGRDATGVVILGGAALDLTLVSFMPRRKAD